MGTSTSYPGPRGGGLLPPWLDDEFDPLEPPADPPIYPADPSEPPLDPPLPSPGPPVLSWRGPKIILGRMARGTSPSTPAGFRSLGRSYVRAGGGSQRSAAGAVAGRRMTGRLATLISGVVRDGVTATLERLGLAQLIGADAGTVILTLTDWLGGDGALLEDAAARDAAIGTLTALAERCSLDTEGIGGFASLGVEGLRVAVELSITNYLVARVERDLIYQIERSQLAPAEANRLLRDLRDFIQVDVQLTFGEVDPLRIDWQGAEGLRAIRQLYRRAYAIFGGE